MMGSHKTPKSPKAQLLKLSTFKPPKLYALLLSALCIFYSLAHIYITLNPVPEILQRAFHLCFGMGLIFVLFGGKGPFGAALNGAFGVVGFLLSLSGFLYLLSEYQSIATSRGGIPNALDIAFGIIATLLVLEATRRVTGLILPLIALLFLLYPFISHLDFMPHRLLTRPYGLDDIFSQLYLKTEGLFSTAIGASASFIFLFILFGAFLNASGMSRLFNDLALALAGKASGGPAKVAVISSGLMGSINGSAIANVVGTGSFTIPLMKKIGYGKDFAGAIEASASVGGQILPPIMGASAFIMAETTGISYASIALAALLPALLYFLAVLLQVHFYAKKHNLQGLSKDSLPLLKDVLKARGHMLLPMAFLIFLLGQGLPIASVALYTIGFSVVVSWLRRDTAMGLRKIAFALEDGAKQSLPVMIACAAVGIIIGVASLTSLGNVITSGIVSLGGGSLFLSLLLTMLASMVLGMGLPSIPAYIITATMAAPALANFGVPLLISHLFVFYFGIFANITPPVALASFAAAGISQGDPMKTSFYALRLAIVGFIIPFVFVYNPALLLLDSTNLQEGLLQLPSLSVVVLVCGSAFLAIFALSAAIEGYFIAPLSLGARVFVGGCAFLLLWPEGLSDLFGAAGLVLLFLLSRLKRHKG